MHDGLTGLYVRMLVGSVSRMSRNGHGMVLLHLVVGWRMCCMKMADLAILRVVGYKN